MFKSRACKFVALLAACLLLMADTGFTAAIHPNIVLIMADDLGYETIAANGGESYATPRLDALAGTGIEQTSVANRVKVNRTGASHEREEISEWRITGEAS